MPKFEIIKIKSTKVKKWGLSVHNSNNRFYIEFNFGIKSYMIGV